MGVPRREFVRSSLGWTLAAVPALGRGVVRRRTSDRPPVPKVNGGINVQPLRRLGPDVAGGALIVPELVALQLRAVYELGFEALRITMPSPADFNNFLGAIPYVRAARALGIDAVVILADFSGFALAQALADPRRRGPVLGLYHALLAGPRSVVSPLIPRAGRLAFQVLNEPTHFLGLPPESYVRELLAPVFAELRRMDPEVLVVSAAEVGNVDGPLRMRAMLEAGLEQACDRIAYHVYSRKALPLLSARVRRLVWVTESGAEGTPAHLPWVREVFPEILATIREASRIFYFDLYDGDRERFRLIDIQPDGSGYRALGESAELLRYFSGRVADAAGGESPAAFEELVPDVTAYFPSDADVRAAESVRVRL